jgi:hypothetical protein
MITGSCQPLPRKAPRKVKATVDCGATIGTEIAELKSSERSYAFSETAEISCGSVLPSRFVLEDGVGSLVPVIQRQGRG